MTKEQIRERLAKCHKEELSLNKQMGAIGKHIGFLERRKAKLAKLVSKNMKYRNSLIAKL
jgi:hypothetical protein